MTINHKFTLISRCLKKQIEFCLETFQTWVRDGSLQRHQFWELKLILQAVSTKSMQEVWSSKQISRWELCNLIFRPWNTLLERVYINHLQKSLKVMRPPQNAKKHNNHSWKKQVTWTQWKLKKWMMTKERGKMDYLTVKWAWHLLGKRCLNM